MTQTLPPRPPFASTTVKKNTRREETAVSQAGSIQFIAIGVCKRSRTGAESTYWPHSGRHRVWRQVWLPCLV